MLSLMVIRSHSRLPLALWTVGVIVLGLLDPLVSQLPAQQPTSQKSATNAAEPAWGFREGERWFVVDKVTQTQTTKIAQDNDAGEPLEDTQQTERTTFSRFDIVSVRPTGDVDMAMTLLDIQNRHGQSTELGRRVAGIEFRWRLTPVGEIADFEGYEKFVSQVAAGNLEFARLLETILSRQTLQQTALEFLQTAPRRSESFDIGWERQSEISLGPLGALQVKRSFQSAIDEQQPPELLEMKYGAPTRHMRFEGSARYVPPDGSSRQVTFDIKSGDLTVQELNGSAWLGAEDRRLVALETRLKVRGTFDMKVGDDRATVTLEQTEDSLLRISEQDPRESATTEQ